MTTGHIRQRSTGSFELRYRVDGKVKTEAFRGSGKKAQARLRELLTAADKGQHVDRSKVTVEAWIADRIAIWDVGTRTRENYQNLHKLIAAHLGDVQIQRLNTLDIERWHAALRTGHAPSTIRAAHRLLVRALADAVHHRQAGANVAREQPPPRAPARKVAVPTEDAIGPMLDRLRGDPFYVPALLTVLCGLRRGELLALSWQHVDLDAGTLTVCRALDQTAAGGVAFKNPKTESGERTISLPAAAVDALREHRRQQLEMRLALGVGRPPDDALVFPAAEPECVLGSVDQDCEAARPAGGLVARAAPSERVAAAAPWGRPCDRQPKVGPQPPRHHGAALPAQHHCRRSPRGHGARQGARPVKRQASGR